MPRPAPPSLVAPDTGSTDGEHRQLTNIVDCPAPTHLTGIGMSHQTLNLQFQTLDPLPLIQNSFVFCGLMCICKMQRILHRVATFLNCVANQNHLILND